MRYLIGIIIFAAALCAIIFWFNSRNQDTGDMGVDEYFGQIKKGMQLGSYHKFQTENGIVTVGDTKSGGQIKPQVTLSKWDDEAKMDIRYEMPQDSTTETLDNKIIWHDKKQEVFLKTIPKQQFTGPIAPTNALDNGKLRYISIKDASLKDVAASYQIFNKTKSSQPSILGVALKEAGYVFFGDRDVEVDLKNPRGLPYPMVRISTEDKFKCPVIPTAENGTFAIFFYYPQIKSRGNEIKDMLVASINESLSKYGQKDFVKRQGDFLYYTKGLQIKPLGRIATDQNTVGLNVFVKTPYNTPLKDYMRPTLQLLRDKYIIPTGGLEELSKDIKPSIVEEIIPRFAARFKEKLESGVFAPDEARTFDELKAQQTIDFVIANVKNDVPVDKFEFDIVLHQKPETNIFTYDILTEGLDFLYQPPLTEEEKDQGMYRPENVIGSYAVYKSGSKSLYTSTEEAQKYQAGKVFHIYRPKIIDSTGNWTWGVLNIDKNKSQLSIVVDQNWLNTASYPVTVDPTFGYTTIGASTGSFTNGYITGSIHTLIESGTGASMSMYVGDVNNRIRLGIYKFNDSSFVVGSSDAFGVDNSWNTSSLNQGNASLSPNDYLLVAWLGCYGVKNCYGGIPVPYDTVAGFKEYTYQYSYFSGDGSTQNPVNDWPTTGTFTESTSNNKYSIYATYTAPGSTKTNLKGNVNLRGGVNLR